jgi:putative tricarboxylic transport membrane protein
MRLGDAFAAGFWLVLALGIAAAGQDLGLGTLRDPGSGFMIFWIGVVMTLLSAATLVSAVRQPAGVAFGTLWRGLRWQVVPYVAVLLALYAWLLPVVGFPLVTFLLLLTLFKTIETQTWTVAVLGAVLGSAVCYVIFDRLLGTQLPAGVLQLG